MLINRLMFRVNRIVSYAKTKSYLTNTFRSIMVKPTVFRSLVKTNPIKNKGFVSAVSVGIGCCFMSTNGTFAMPMSNTKKINKYEFLEMIDAARRVRLMILQLEKTILFCEIEKCIDDTIDNIENNNCDIRTDYTNLVERKDYTNFVENAKSVIDLTNVESVIDLTNVESAKSVIDLTNIENAKSVIDLTNLVAAIESASLDDIIHACKIINDNLKANGYVSFNIKEFKNPESHKVCIDKLLKNISDYAINLKEKDNLIEEQNYQIRKILFEPIIVSSRYLCCITSMIASCQKLTLMISQDMDGII